MQTSSDGTQSEIRGATSASYILSVEDIGFFVSVSCEPVRSDWARGPIVLSEQIGPIIPGPPTCQSLEFLGSLIEGQRLSFVASYSGGERGNCFYEWFRVKSNGVKERLTTEEFLDLTFDDVGRRIELVYSPCEKTESKGGTQWDWTLLFLIACEDNEVVPHKKYFGGQEGVGEYIWYRSKNKLHESELMDISEALSDVHICGKTLTYTPSLEDVGAYLALYWLPTREDGRSGNPLVAISDSPVTPEKRSSNSFQCSCERSYLRVYILERVNILVDMRGQASLAGTEKVMKGLFVSLMGLALELMKLQIQIIIIVYCSGICLIVDCDFVAFTLMNMYTPVRSDSVVGELKLSEPTDIILPELPRVEMLALTGKAIEGDVLTAVEVIPKSEIQQCVWSKYKKDVRYQWFCSSEGDDKSFEPLPTQRSCSYKVRLEDVGRCLKCECIVTDVFGRSSELAYAETTPVLPGYLRFKFNDLGIPRIDKLEIEGRGFHTNLYAVRGIYSGGKEGKSRIQWLRAMVGSPDLISIQGETGRMYEAYADDVGYRLVAIYTPVREDGVEGQPVSASTDPIAVEPDVLKEVKQKVDLGAVKFEVLCDKDRTPKKVPGEGSLERRILEINRKRVKVVKPGSKTSFPTTEIRGSYAPPFHVELFRNDQRRLRIVVDSENEVDLMVHSRHLRDVIVLTLRGLAQRFNSTSLNSLLKIET
ncbi:hypothetical protein Patl1_11265 [Pistacia atlantica]|uniref:Uncharacterized protein n=1 Tax=Pistacia atlantica TaxID=434234 RepID=A0ACC1A684_9ROSI|nr:hypothetical protein Patl1_11265 [Pistacia atlantica]